MIFTELLTIGQIFQTSADLRSSLQEWSKILATETRTVAPSLLQQFSTSGLVGSASPAGC